MRLRAASAASTIRARDAASCSRASTFASAAVTSSAKLLIRSSVPVGNAYGSSLVAMIAPQRRPATWIGAPTTERTPNSRSLAASSPSTSW
jgi:uncharacterized protein involved in propanediol utilization